MTGATERSSDTCYRHPDRQSFVLCQRCGRTICPACQTPAAVGVHCPDCIREARASAPRARSSSRIARVFRPGSSSPAVTWTIAAITVLVFVGQLIGQWSGADYVSGYLEYFPPLTPVMPWTMLTYALVHGGLLHILFNLYALLVVGPILELALGRWRFLALYVLAAFGGAVAVLWLSPGTPVMGASGAVFGLFAALVIVQRGLGSSPTGLIIVIGLNLLIGFLPGFNVSWQAHVGGLVVGAVIAAAYRATRHRARRGAQIGLLALVAVVLVALTVLRFAIA